MNAEIVPILDIVPFEPERDSPEYSHLREMIGIVGILTPVIGRRGEDGRVHILDGKWRVLAARANRHREIQMMIVDLTEAEAEEYKMLLSSPRRNA